jgi:hypothetical protein
MTPTKSRHGDPESRLILATVDHHASDGDSFSANCRESQLKDTIWREVQTRRFMNTQDSAWSILDTILDIDPIKLPYFQDELQRICTTLPVPTLAQFAPRSNRSYFSSLFGFKSGPGRRVSA